jgi:hypothetical protein
MVCQNGDIVSAGRGGLLIMSFIDWLPPSSCKIFSGYQPLS